MEIWKDDVLIAGDIVVAASFFKRLAGLMGRRPQAGRGLLLTPCHAVHTSFMRDAIDIVFLDAQFRILKIEQELPPWKSAACRKAAMTLEVARGCCSGIGLQPGDTLRPEPEVRWQAAHRRRTLSHVPRHREME